MYEMLFGYYRVDQEREAAAAIRRAQVRRVMDTTPAPGGAQPAATRRASAARAWFRDRLPFAHRRQSPA